MFSKNLFYALPKMSKIVSCLAMMFLGLALAQDTKVSVRIPVLLKLSLDGQVMNNQVDVPLNIYADDGLYQISPAQTQLKVLSNTTWQLSIQTLQHNPRSKISYRLDVDKPWKQIREYSQAVMQGRGLQHSEMTIHYGFNQKPSDGTYQLRVSYTLSNP